MGIRFRCPNGHKLNVKTFLAGKRGVCPDCGQTFRIPPEGTDDSGVVAMPLESRRAGAVGGEPDNLVESDFETAVAVAAAAVSEPTQAAPAGVLFLPPMPSQQVTAAAPATPIAKSPVPNGPAPAIPEVYFPEPAAAPTLPQPTLPQPTLPKPALPPAPTALPVPPTPPTPIDPIAEAPNAVWYVRPPSGGQYGPARGDVMRKWIGEGRVSSDSLVWREGWTDWRDAGRLFPTLATPASTPTSAAPTFPTPLATAAAPQSSPTALNIPAVAPRATATRPADRKPTGTKGSSQIAVAALVCLVLVCLILVAVLAIVLSQGSA
jgi:hypothetical protein